MPGTDRTPARHSSAAARVIRPPVENVGCGQPIAAHDRCAANLYTTVSSVAALSVHQNVLLNAAFGRWPSALAGRTKLVLVSNEKPFVAPDRRWIVSVVVVSKGVDI